ncbi:hypothetical protein PBY51_015458 [Eleginops maclovinus]|uniref:Uncharacterized protein n=1 Tax=Eleginops maclovinus TaxID=56733 RepID=A0AAN8AFT5_ELEMC|nr:hypothetical protein PBY51_015458 [Eleginops maclovinus]
MMLTQSPCEKSTVEKDVIGFEFESPRTLASSVLPSEGDKRRKRRGGKRRTEEIRLDLVVIEFTLGVVHQAELTSDPDASYLR